MAVNNVRHCFLCNNIYKYAEDTDLIDTAQNERESTTSLDNLRIYTFRKEHQAKTKISLIAPDKVFFFFNQKVLTCFLFTMKTYSVGTH